MKKVYYWHDELNDDFASTNIETKNIPSDYKFYSRNPIYLALEVLIHALALPLIYLMIKIIFLARIKNKKVLKSAKGKGYFLYANHTNYLLDAYMPSIIAAPSLAHIIVNPDAVSIKGIATIVKMLGAIPISSSLKGLVKLKEAVKVQISHKRVIAIYPEAHIWPFYTDIRHFGKQSFHYPVESNAPSFAFTNIYTQRKLKFIKFPKVVTYIDGPFYPDQSLDKTSQIEKLQSEIYMAMKKRVDANPKYNYADYVYVDDEAKTNKKNKR